MAIITIIIVIAAVVALNRARWVRQHRLRAWYELAALLAPGLALMAWWACSQGAKEIGAALTATAAVLTAAACLTARAPAWPVEGMRAGVTIRKARAGLRDLPEVVRLVRLSFGRLPVSSVLLAWWALSGRCFIERCEAGQIAGCVVTFPPRRGVTWVELLAVHPDHWRRGVASRLLDGLELVYLIVRESNTGALAFYRRVGFEIVDVWRGYYDNDEGAVVMQH